MNIVGKTIKKVEEPDGEHIILHFTDGNKQEIGDFVETTIPYPYSSRMNKQC